MMKSPVFKQPLILHKTFSRDYGYKHLGTLSLLTGIYLQTGEAIPLVKESHYSKDWSIILFMRG